MTLEKTMKHRLVNLQCSVRYWLAGGLVVCILMPGVLQAAPQATGKTAARAQTFATPQQAAEALIAAAEKYDIAALEAILGPESHDIVVSGEPLRDCDL